MRHEGRVSGTARLGIDRCALCLGCARCAGRICGPHQHDAATRRGSRSAAVGRGGGANSGIEYAATRLLAPAANCGNLANLNVSGYAVAYKACARVQYVVNSVTVNVYTVTLTSSRGVYGTPE